MIKAKQTRKQAWQIAENQSHPSAIQAKLNWLKYTNQPSIREVVADEIEQLPTNHRQIQLLIALAKVSEQPEIYLHRALQLATEIDDYLSLAMASAQLGQVYEQQQKYQMALSYTEQAEQYIYPLLIYDYLYQYQWQEARIYEALNQLEPAKSAYRRSLDSLSKIRPQIALAGKNAQFDFQESVEPIYRGLLRLLLAANPSPSDLEQSLAVFDRFQLAQLENLFADLCFGDIQDVTEQIQAENIAIISPIILEQQFQVVAFTPDGKYYHHSELISSEFINQKIAQWRLDLMNIETEEYINNSAYFYDILFKPFEEIIANINPRTIVFINDGLLRNVPMAALYDSQNRQFLIEKYPISVALGQNFLPFETPSLSDNSLAFGLSEALPPINVALPNVERELQSLENIIKADTVINEKFTKQNLQAKIKENSFSVLHLATHLILVFGLPLFLMAFNLGSRF